MKPIAFTRFVAALGLQLTPAQRAVTLVAFDGLEPRDLDGEDRELARELFGDVDTVPPMARTVIVVKKGARIGGTYLCALRALQLALTVSLETLAPGEIASALFVAPDMRLARQGLRYASGAVARSPAMRRCLVREGADGFLLRRDDGREVALECLPATRGGSALRGRSLVAAVFTESAFFRDADFVVNDQELYRSVLPRILPGGQLLCESTPFAEFGLLFDLFTANHGHPVGALAAHAPTLLMRPDDRTRALVEQERQRDPDNARREFDAEFMSAGTGLFFDPAALDACVDETLSLPAPHLEGISVVFGGDCGFTSDSSALAGVRRDGADLVPVCLDEQRPVKGAPLKPSAVVARFAEVMGRYHATELVADGHYKESVREHLDEHHLTLRAAPEGQGGKATTYLALRKLVNERRIRLPNHPRLLAQLKAIVSKPAPGGGLTISSPRRRGGGHGDLVSALVLAAWRASSRSSRQRAQIPGASMCVRPSYESQTLGFESDQTIGGDSADCWGDRALAMQLQAHARERGLL